MSRRRTGTASRTAQPSGPLRRLAFAGYMAPRRFVPLFAGLTALDSGAARLHQCHVRPVRTVCLHQELGGAVSSTLPVASALVVAASRAGQSPPPLPLLLLPEPLLSLPEPLLSDSLGSGVSPRPP